MTDIQQKINSIREALKNIEKESPQYAAYLDVIKDLEKMEPPAVRIHINPSDQLCDGCQ